MSLAFLDRALFSRGAVALLSWLLCLCQFQHHGSCGQVANVGNGRNGSGFAQAAFV